MTDPLLAVAAADRVLAALAALARACTTLHVGTIPDEEDEPLYSVVGVLPGGARRSGLRRTLAGAILAAAGQEPVKRCAACDGGKGRYKPVGEFGANRSQPDGLNRYCRVCERARLADVKARRRAARRTDPPAA